ncbi:MAG TPA: hypothetical protein VJU54_03335 [Nitrospiraceae bacterium]|nr:hypothetical protein [Nitrospiraceae bacterium]
MPVKELQKKDAAITAVREFDLTLERNLFTPHFIAQVKKMVQEWPDVQKELEQGVPALLE